MDQNSNPHLYTCAISGEQSPGKHYVLTTTEGQEVVCPEALFHNGADRRLAAVLVELQHRVIALEKTVHPEEPAKKTAAKKTVPARKAAD